MWRTVRGSARTEGEGEQPGTRELQREDVDDGGGGLVGVCDDQERGRGSWGL